MFIGPGPDVMRAVGDKIGAKRLAEEAGVPVAPWSGGPVETVDEALGHARRIGFPLMIKATAGGGGRGIRRVDHERELSTAFASARAEAFAAFGDGTLLLEKLITPARHIEVQIIADGHGHVWAVGVRDCSYQRRNQKVVEESSSPALTAEQEHEIMEAAKRLARARRLPRRRHGRVSLRTPRAAVLVHGGQRPAAGRAPGDRGRDGTRPGQAPAARCRRRRLEGDPPPPRGHAIEARLNAEDPALGFAPAPGSSGRICGCRPGPGCASTPASPRAT